MPRGSGRQWPFARGHARSASFLGWIGSGHYAVPVTATRSLDAAVLRDAMFLFHQALLEHRDELNSLNVYPVPDGDTGTNLLLTQQAVRDELSRLGGGSLGEVAEAIARSSLMGARGNSGVILAQALRGLTDELAADGAGDTASLARGLRRAADEAFRAVARPARGTVLDVLADAADAADRAAKQDADPSWVITAALEGSRRALARTKEDLAELRRAGRVGAG